MSKVNGLHIFSKYYEKRKRPGFISTLHFYKFIFFKQAIFHLETKKFVSAVFFPDNDFFLSLQYQNVQYVLVRS